MTTSVYILNSENIKHIVTLHKELPIGRIIVNNRVIQIPPDLKAEALEVFCKEKGIDYINDKVRVSVRSSNYESLRKLLIPAKEVQPDWTSAPLSEFLNSEKIAMDWWIKYIEDKKTSGQELWKKDGGSEEETNLLSKEEALNVIYQLDIEGIAHLPKSKAFLFATKEGAMFLLDYNKSKRVVELPHYKFDLDYGFVPHRYFSSEEVGSPIEDELTELFLNWSRSDYQKDLFDKEEIRNAKQPEARAPLVKNNDFTEPFLVNRDPSPVSNPSNLDTTGVRNTRELAGESSVKSEIDLPKLKLALDRMEEYGQSLKEKKSNKGQIIINLAKELKSKAKDFEPHGSNDLNKSKDEFIILLCSKNEDLSKYRVSWETILKNVLIALTGIGGLAILGQLAYSKATKDKPLFFFQKEKTTSEELVEDVKNILKK